MRGERVQAYRKKFDKRKKSKLPTERHRRGASRSWKTPRSSRPVPSAVLSALTAPFRKEKERLGARERERDSERGQGREGVKEKIL